MKENSKAQASERERERDLKLKFKGIEGRRKKRTQIYEIDNISKF